ncbi:MAG: magnesium transporter CorA family protein [Firmicutes bacterium]|nr:magnesium transporter CorA family protein [Bacillota bacterium]
MQVLRAYKSEGDSLVVAEDLREKGVWINLVNPTDAEIARVAEQTNLMPDMLRAALDEEERSRIEVEEDQILILINVPIECQTDNRLIYDTVPMGIVVSDRTIVTVCLQESAILNEFESGRLRSFFTFKKTRFLLQVLFKTATQYLRYLRDIDRRSTQVESELHKSMRNEELIRLLNLEKSLVYFTTSLRANQIVLDKLFRSVVVKADPDAQAASRILTMYDEDQDLLEDVIVENKQAIEMGEIYSNILSGMMDAFASVISNNLNIVMKFLTSVTIILAVPTMVASFFGMNVALPLSGSPLAFLFIVMVSAVLSVSGAIILRRMKML